MRQRRRLRRHRLGVPVRLPGGVPLSFGWQSTVQRDRLSGRRQRRVQVHLRQGARAFDARYTVFPSKPQFSPQLVHVGDDEQAGRGSDLRLFGHGLRPHGHVADAGHVPEDGLDECENVQAQRDHEGRMQLWM